MRLARSSSVRARRRLLATGAVVAAALLVAGCTGSEPAEPEPTTSTAEAEPTETPEPSPTETGPVKPERPAAMEQEDAAGAAAAAEYFMSLIPYALVAQDSAELASLSHETCGFCASNLEDIQWLIDNKGTYEGGSLEVEISDPGQYQRDEATGIFPLDATVAQGAIRVIDGAGVEVGNVAATTWDARIEVGRQDGEWVIVEVAALDGTDA